MSHGYAITVHRSQGATVDTAHRLEDGGGRELAYVSMSPSPATLDRLRGRRRRRPSRRRSATGLGPTTPATMGHRLGHTLHRPRSGRGRSRVSPRRCATHCCHARLQAERDAIASLAPPDVARRAGRSSGGGHRTPTSARQHPPRHRGVGRNRTRRPGVDDQRHDQTATRSDLAVQLVVDDPTPAPRSEADHQGRRRRTRRAHRSVRGPR